MNNDTVHTEQELKEYMAKNIKSNISSSSSGSLYDTKWFQKLADNNYIGGDAFMVLTYSKGRYDGFAIRKVLL